MKVRPLVLGKKELTAIHDAVEAARANPTPWEVLAPFAKSDALPVLTLADRNAGNADLAHKLVSRSKFVELPFGYLAAISFEVQPAGLCRHLSISVASSKGGQLPSVEAVKMIAGSFGFEDLENGRTRLWVEEFVPGEYAVNVVQVEP